MAVRTLAAAALLTCGLFAVPAAAAGLTRTDLQRHDLSVPGYETVQIRVDFAPGATAARHSHPGEEIIYVLAGTLKYQIDGSAPVVVGAGQVFFVPAGAIHQATNIGSTVASELATYVVKKGQPLITPAP